MVSYRAIAHDLSGMPDVHVRQDAPLHEYTRFGIGGPAAVLAETASESRFIEVLGCVATSGLPYVVIGGGTNLIASDSGYPGVVLRFTNSDLSSDGNHVYAAAGAALQDLVDYSIACGLAGIHTMTGIPGSVGAAVYGNAGAYGRSLSESVVEVRYLACRDVRKLSRAECEFHYRESIFKRNKDWIVFSVVLALEPGEAADLRRKADEILAIRNRKYPQTMKCAGSIFKNLILAELPDSLKDRIPAKAVIEGKVPSAWFLEQVGAKGMTKGGIRVADYHANLIYNEGHGTAAELREVIRDLKQRVADRFGLVLEEEVQYLGFDSCP
jgi:UDP-N-acetylmuramate dehydrogenase